jgi:hypothetical protein
MQFLKKIEIKRNNPTGILKKLYFFGNVSENDQKLI